MQGLQTFTNPPNPYPPQLQQPPGTQRPTPQTANPQHVQFEAMAAKVRALVPPASAALQAYQSGQLAGPAFEQAIQQAIDQRHLIVEGSALGRALSHLRRNSGVSAVVAQTVLAGQDFTDLFTNPQIGPALQTQEFTNGLMWGASLQSTPLGAVKAMPATLSEPAKAEVSAMIEQTISDKLGSINALTQAALSSLSKAADTEGDRAKTSEKLRVELEKLLKEAPDELKRIRESFTFQGSTRAAFEHWDSKSREHRRHSNHYLIAFGLTVVAFLAALITIDRMAIPGDVRFLDVPFAAIALLTMTTGAAIWIGRLIAKQYVTERYLGEDASERSAMIRTFASMVQFGQIEGGQVSTVLTAIFRSGATGLVPEDGSPTLPFEAIAKLVGKDKVKV